MARTTRAAAEAARQKIAAGTAATMRNLHDPDRERLADDVTAPIPAEAEPVPEVIVTFDGPVSQTTVDLVKAHDRPDREQKYADLAQIVRGAEALRFDAQTTYELERQLDAASDLLALARAQEANGEHVNVEILRGLRERNDRYSTQLEGWLQQRGVKNDGAGS